MWAHPRSGHNCVIPTLTGVLQRHRRSPVSGQGHYRMASSSGGNFKDISDIRGATDRPIRIFSCTRSSALRITGPLGRSSGDSQCLQQAMEIPARVGVSPSVTYAKGVDTSQQLQGSIRSDCAPVAEVFLETRSPKQSPQRANYPRELERDPSGHGDRPHLTEGGRSNSGGLVDWSWDSPLENWTPQERDVLMSGWRKSTLSSYKSAWRRWGKWCENNNISAISPQAKDLAKFLAHLHLKENLLAPSTIHLHRSVVSTICEPFIGKKLSDHIFVRRVLKSVSQAKPKLNRIPIWDPQVVVHWMQSNNPDPISLFEANRRCATILLLASGRRVHDLTLLYSSPEHIVDDGTNIILWPIFGSKTDSARFQQSGWKLIPHVDNLLNPVYWIRKVRELSSNRRGSIQQLFITTQGEPKPASKTVIANWVKTVLKAAGIEASPGSSRSAVASYNWLCNLSIDSILKKGNWKQASTFYRHYCKEVKRSHNEIIPNLSSLFDPV